MKKNWLKLILIFSDLVYCISLSGYVEPQVKDLAQIKVVINGGEFISHCTENGGFYFPNVPSGSHLLEVLSNTYSFDKIKIDVGLDDAGQEKIKASIGFTGLSWDKDGPVAEIPLFLSPKAEYRFEKEPTKFSIWSIIGNPMILMTVVPLGLLLLMPKLMENMDPEALKEFKESQRIKGNPAKPIEMPDVSQHLANWFAPADAQDNSQTSLKKQTNAKKRK